MKTQFNWKKRDDELMNSNVFIGRKHDQSMISSINNEQSMISSITTEMERKPISANYSTIEWWFRHFTINKINSKTQQKDLINNLTPWTYWYLICSIYFPLKLNGWLEKGNANFKYFGNVDNNNRQRQEDLIHPNSPYNLKTELIKDLYSLSNYDTNVHISDLIAQFEEDLEFIQDINLWKKKEWMNKMKQYKEMKMLKKSELTNWKTSMNYYNESVNFVNIETSFFTLKNNYLHYYENKTISKRKAIENGKVITEFEEIVKTTDIENMKCCVCNDCSFYNQEMKFTCCKCFVTVHRECYKISMTESKLFWLCDLCITKSQEESWNTECILCPVKGGAMKEVSVPYDCEFMEKMNEFKDIFNYNDKYYGKATRSYFRDNNEISNNKDNDNDKDKVKDHDDNNNNISENDSVTLSMNTIEILADSLEPKFAKNKIKNKNKKNTIAQKSKQLKTNNKERSASLPLRVRPEEWFRQHPFRSMFSFRPDPRFRNKNIIIPFTTYKNIKHDIWAHISCVIFNESLRLCKTDDQVYIKGIDKINLENFKNMCHLCKKKGWGPLTKCSRKLCVYQVHPECARINELQIDIDGRRGIIFHHITCLKHKENKLQKIMNCTKMLKDKEIMETAEFIKNTLFKKDDGLQHISLDPQATEIEGNDNQWWCENNFKNEIPIEWQVEDFETDWKGNKSKQQGMDHWVYVSEYSKDNNNTLQEGNVFSMRKQKNTTNNYVDFINANNFILWFRWLLRQIIYKTIPLEQSFSEKIKKRKIIYEDTLHSSFPWGKLNFNDYDINQLKELYIKIIPNEETFQAIIMSYI